MPWWPTSRPNAAPALAATALAMLVGACLEVPSATEAEGHNCSELPRDGSLASDVYTFDVDGDPVPMYCNMDIDHGGWTLIGRSVSAGISDGFGWFERNGDVTDPRESYSLGLARNDGWVHEILVGRTDDGTSLPAQAFVLTIPASANFPADYGDTLIDVEVSVQQIATDCSRPPSLLAIIGNASDSSRFVLTGEGGTATDGLGPSGFDFDDNSCDTTGNLRSKQGLLFVR